MNMGKSRLFTAVNPLSPDETWTILAEAVRNENLDMVALTVAKGEFKTREELEKALDASAENPEEGQPYWLYLPFDLMGALKLRQSLSELIRFLVEGEGEEEGEKRFSTPLSPPSPLPPAPREAKK